jgi:hypothetical protein
MADVDKCEDGMIEGYPDLEIANIDRFMGDLMEKTKTLVVDVDMAVEFMGRIAEIKEGDGLDPKLEKLAGPQDAHDTRQSPEMGCEELTR